MTEHRIRSICVEKHVSERVQILFENVLKRTLPEPGDNIIHKTKYLDVHVLTSTFVHVYLEIWNNGVLKFNKFSM